MILKVILLYFVFEALSIAGVCAEIGCAMVMGWLNSLKKERILPFSSYLSILNENAKKLSNSKGKTPTYIMCIPFLNMLYVPSLLMKSCKEVINSPKFMEESHDISSIEQEKINEIKRDNGLNIVNQFKELQKFVIRPVDIETVLIPIENGRYYMVGETYTFDECSYVSFGTNMRINFGKINGNMYAIFDGCEEEIKELFPSFIPINPDKITDEKMSLIFLHRPNDADICYIITHILSTREAREVIDSEIIPEESNNNGNIVKLTK